MKPLQKAAGEVMSSAQSTQGEVKEKEPFKSTKKEVPPVYSESKEWTPKGNRWLNGFLEIFQAIFNRRICSFRSLALQVGDLFIMGFGILYTVLCCISMKNEKNSGSGAQILLAITVVLGCRNGLLSYIFGLSLERSVLWHQFYAWCSLISSCNHWYRSKGIVSGWAIEGVLIALVLLSIKPIRRNLWELFMKAHWILIFLLLITCVWHSVGLGIATLVYFILDVAFRIYQAMKYRDMSFSLYLERIGQNIVKCSFKKGSISYEGGQYFFMMIPQLTSFQWHPFSVFSAPHEDNIIIYVKVLGDWTEQLYDIAGQEGSPVVVKSYLDGPYGVHSIFIRGEKYKNFICVSGGIGVTPIISTAKELLHQKSQGRPLNSLAFIWAGRDKEIVNKIVHADELDCLLKQDDKSIVQSFYHLTQSGKEQSDIELQESHIKVLKGRPLLTKYFEDAHKLALSKGEHLVAVLACGPQALIDSVELLSQKWSTNGVRFDVHQEVFNF